MEYLESRRGLIEDRFNEVVGRVEPEELHAQVEHVALAGGKRVRPVVTLLACETVGGDPSNAIDYAVGVELVHNASLVVDDIIDKSSVRRGNASAWAAFGHGNAVLTSDGLMGQAFSLFSPNGEAMERVADAIVELGEGEAIELVSELSTEAEYMDLARRKTGALFRAAAELGGIAAGTDERTIRTLGKYAEHVGVAFQIRDDVLDTVADADKLGKPTGRDVVMERPSLVRVANLTPGEANNRAHAQAELAREALEDVSVCDERAYGYLEDLAGFVVTREH